MQFVIERRSGTMSMTALCRAFGISRQTGYKWMKRFSMKDPSGSLEEHSRRPLSSPAVTAKPVIRKILACRRLHPTWGAKKLLPILLEQWPSWKWPAASTVGDILKRNDLVEPRRARKNRLNPRTKPFSDCANPNDVWCVDFKGDFRTADGTKVYPLTVMDAASRFLLACSGQRAPEGGSVRKTFEDLFRRYGLPRSMRCDNGEPFTAARAPAGISKLSAWWIKLGIRVDRIDPGRPDQNGRHERMHLTLKNETASPPRASFKAQQLAFNAFRQSYNYERPHEALGQIPPARCYRKSMNVYEPDCQPFEYPFSATRMVGADGHIRWPERRIFVSSTLAGELVGVQQLDERYAEVSFGPIILGLLDGHQLHRGLLRPRVDGRRERFKVSAMSPV